VAQLQQVQRQTRKRPKWSRNRWKVRICSSPWNRVNGWEHSSDREWNRMAIHYTKQLKKIESCWLPASSHGYRVACDIRGCICHKYGIPLAAMNRGSTCHPIHLFPMTDPKQKRRRLSQSCLSR
jgi:hypothetical protein